MNIKIMKFSFFVLLGLVILFSSCNQEQNVTKELVSDNSAISIWSDTLVKVKYEDGSIKSVWGYKPNDNEMHYVWNYYKNGNIWLEGPMYDTLRHGKWKGYNDHGSLIAQGTYRVGQASGIYTVWYDNGVKFYEGDMLKGKRIGEWSFFDKAGKLIKTIDYSKENTIE